MFMNDTRFLKTLIKLLLTLTLIGPIASAENAFEREGRIKAATVLHLIRGTQWPEHSLATKGEPIVVCILGNDPLNDFIAGTMRDKLVHQKELSNYFIYRVNELTRCHVVIFGEGAEEQVYNAVTFQKPGILSIGTSEGFTELGGTIELIRRNNRIEIYIEEEAISLAQLQLASFLQPYVVSKNR